MNVKSTKQNFKICVTLCSDSLQWLVCLMTIKVTECLTQRGAPAVRDENNYMYTKNSVNKDTVNWRCSKRGCRATLKTEKESLHIVGSILPTHDHENQLLVIEYKLSWHCFD